MFNNNNNNSERLATTTTLAADFLHCSLKLGFVRAICPLNTSWKARSWPRPITPREGDMSTVVDEVSRSELALLVRQYLLDDFPATARTFAAEAAALLQHAPTPGPQQHVKGLHAIVNEYVGLSERARRRESFSRTFGDSALARSCLGKIELLLDDYVAATGPREAGQREAAPVQREAGHRTHAHAGSGAAAPTAAGSIALAASSVPATRGDAPPPRGAVPALPLAASHTTQGPGPTEGQGTRRSRKSVQPRRRAVSHVRVSHVDSRQLFGARASSCASSSSCSSCCWGKGARGSSSASAGRASSAGTGRGAGAREAGAHSPGLAELLGASGDALAAGGAALQGDGLQGDGLQIAERIAQTINSVSSSMQPADLQPGGELPPALSAGGGSLAGGSLSVEQIVATLLADPGSLAMLALDPCAGSPPLPLPPPPQQQRDDGEPAAPPRPASPPRSPPARPPPLPPHALGALAPPPLRPDTAPGLARGAPPSTPQLPLPAAPRAAPYRAVSQVQGVLAKRSTARKPSAPKPTKPHATPPNATPVGGRDGRAAAPAIVPPASKRPRADG